jgi:hypothetical protein
VATRQLRNGGHPPVDCGDGRRVTVALGSKSVNSLSAIAHGERHMNIDKQRLDAVGVLESLGYTFSGIEGPSAASQLTWKGGALYAGQIYLGYVSRVVPIDWRNHLTSPCGDASLPSQRALHMNRDFFESHDATPWCGWLMTNDKERAAGYWASEAAAIVSLEALAETALAMRS